MKLSAGGMLQLTPRSTASTPQGAIEDGVLPATRASQGRTRLYETGGAADMQGVDGLDVLLEGCFDLGASSGRTFTLGPASMVAHAPTPWLRKSATA